MHAAQVTEWGQPPRYAPVPDPVLEAGQVKVKVEAVGLHNLVRVRASGKHYSASSLPHIPGVDGVGLLEDGTRVYFTSFTPSGGSLGDYVVVSERAVTPLPADLDTIQAAALINPATSSWMSMTARAILPQDFTILIIGATSASGRLAIPLARALGAKKVIGAARSDMSSLDLDERLTLGDDTDFSALEVDVVLDYVYGPTAEQLFKTLKTPRPVQYVQVGVLSSPTITLPGNALRSKDITIRGSGLGSWSPVPDVAEAMPALLQALRKVPHQPVRVASMKDVETEWEVTSKERLVFVP